MQELLVLGLEDEIPLPEAASDPAIAEATSSDTIWEAVAAALRELLDAGLINIYLGSKGERNEIVSPDEARTMLTDPRWYEWRLEDPVEDRLYYINVDNDPIA